MLKKFCLIKKLLMLFLYLYIIFVKKRLIIGPTQVNLYFSLKDYPGKSNFVHEYLGEIEENIKFFCDVLYGPMKFTKNQTKNLIPFKCLMPNIQFSNFMMSEGSKWLRTCQRSRIQELFRMLNFECAQLCTFHIHDRS